MSVAIWDVHEEIINLMLGFVSDGIVEHSMRGELMKCGHVANGVMSDGSPCCVICAFIRPGWNEINHTPPNLLGRKARCGYYQTCHHELSSSLNLPFFEHRPTDEFDKFYCGCRGWD